MTLPEQSQKTHLAPNEVSGANDQSEISLLDIINFLQDSWKKLAIAAVVGAALGFGNWYFLGSYNAELILLNNGGTDLVGLRSLQKSLPNLADQIIDESKVPQGQESLYRTLANPDWWQKNLLPTYGMSKADTKDLASTAGLESAGTSIVSVTVMAGSSSKEKALENVRNAKTFLVQGASYLAIKSLLSSQEAQLSGADAEIAKKINATQVELGYQQERLKSLETLAKRFPNESRVISQVVDPKDSGAKYMPISTQIIAANTDINGSKESLERLKDAQAQTAVLRAWVKQAAPLVEGSYDGLTLIKQLMQEESQLRTSLDLKDPKSLAFVDGLRSILIGMNVRFTKGFEMNTAPTSSGKRGMIKATAGGLAGAFFLMLLVLLCQRVWASIKMAQKAAVSNDR
jgi:hypothetical protein